MKHVRYIALMIAGFVIAFTYVAEAQTIKSELYKVGINDTVNITVIGHPNLSIGALVAVDGTIAFPHLGTLYVKDKTLLEIEAEITNKLGDGYVKYPVVSVALVSSASKKIFIHGEVMKVGTLSFEKDLSLVKVLSLAGGIREEGLYGKLKVRRKRKNAAGYEEVIEAGLNNGILKNREIEDMLLQPDDIVLVERSDSIFIQGQLLSKGRMVLESGMTISRAITLAGGITEDGLHGKLRLRRMKEQSTGYSNVLEVQLANGNLTDIEVQDTLLQKDDILIVDRNESYFIEGEIALPSRYVLEYGITVGRAITVAGGITEGGLYGTVKVRRKREGERGYEDIEIDIEGILEGRESSDMLLQPEDILIVERNKTYIMYGEVNNIGEYPITNDTTVFKAILRAKGFNKWGSESRVKILRSSDDNKEFKTIKVDIKDVLDGNADADIILQQGDIVVVSSGLF